MTTYFHRLKNFEQDIPQFKDDLNQYKWEFIITGRFSTIYKVYNDCVCYAVKEMQFQYNKNDVLSKNALMMLNNILNEITILSDLEHPNIVHFYGYQYNINCISLIFEYIEQDTFTLVSNNSHTAHTYIKPLLKDMVEALKYLKEKNILHRDIKLENILYTKQNTFKLTDFGFAVCLNSEGCDYFKNQICGTLGYSAPELINVCAIEKYKQYNKSSTHKIPISSVNVLKMENYTYKSDIWSLGVCAYIILKQQLPQYSYADLQFYNKVKNETIFTPYEIMTYPEETAYALEILQCNVCERPSVEKIEKILT